MKRVAEKFSRASKTFPQSCSKARKTSISELNAATDGAANALEKFQRQLKDKLPKLPQQTALGRDAYIWFLRNVALMPFTPEELLAMGRQEWNRAVAFEAYEKNRNKDASPLKAAADVNTWIKDAAEKELQIRKYLEERGIFTVPKWVQHYTRKNDVGMNSYSTSTCNPPTHLATNS
jgi:hypothetical protein